VCRQLKTNAPTKHIKRTIRLKARIVFTLNVVIMLW
jgi:hypothetical protein